MVLKSRPLDQLLQSTDLDSGIKYCKAVRSSLMYFKYFPPLKAKLKVTFSRNINISNFSLSNIPLVFVQIDVSFMLLHWCYFSLVPVGTTLELCIQKTWIMM